MSRGPATVRTTVVVVTWRGRDHLADCLAALAAQHSPHRTLVVDNASDDGTADVLAAHPGTLDVLRLPSNRGYAGALAAALPHVHTEYMAWLNDDAAPEPGWLAALESALDDDADLAAVSPRLVYPDGTVQSDGVRLTADGHGVDLRAELGTGLGTELGNELGTGRSRGTAATLADAVGGTGGAAGPVRVAGQRADAVGAEVFGFCGGAALLRTSDLVEAGGVPGGYFCYYEDTDTSWRLRLHGWRIRSVPGAVVRHLHGASSRPGSVAFHRWNERNRLRTLIRCAPGRVVVRELLRFAAITALLPVRRAVGELFRPGRADAPAANFRVGLRLRVLGEILGGLPLTLGERRRIGRTASTSRVRVWSSWAGR